MFQLERKMCEVSVEIVYLVRRRRKLRVGNVHLYLKDLSLKSVFYRLKTCALIYLTLEFFVCLNMCHQECYVRVIVKGKEMEKIGPRLAIHLTDQANVN